MKKKNKTVSILLRLTPSKKAELKAKASASNKNVTEYLTNLIDNGSI
jgi:uncharacterized protein (DUF1778 family)